MRVAVWVELPGNINAPTTAVISATSWFSMCADKPTFMSHPTHELAGVPYARAGTRGCQQGRPACTCTRA